MAHATSGHSKKSRVGSAPAKSKDADAPAHSVPTHSAPAPDEITPAQISMEQALDKGFHAAQAGFTGGLSPIALAETYSDWALYLASAPGKQLELEEKAGKKAWKFANYAATCALHSNANANANDACIEPLPQDKRFSGEAWQKWPFNVMSQAFLLNQQW
jgi:polyhydroxyalkanoate synthase